jgi:hypothetical protein
MMMIHAQHQAQIQYMQQVMINQQAAHQAHNNQYQQYPHQYPYPQLYNPQQYNPQQYNPQQYNNNPQQYPAPQESAQSEAIVEASSSLPTPPPSSSSATTSAPSTSVAAPVLPQLSSSPTSEDPRSASPTPIPFSNIISETSSVVTPSAMRIVRPSTSSPSVSISLIDEKDSSFILKKMKEFKDFSHKEDHVRFWCKCDTCVFFAKNGVDIRIEGHMKYLIMDKKMTFLSFFYRTKCKCGNNSKDCPVPPNKLSMFYAHKDDKDFNDPMVSLDWGKRCQRAHCWNPACDRTHFPFTFRGDRKF